MSSLFSKRFSAAKTPSNINFAKPHPSGPCRKTCQGLSVFEPEESKKRRERVLLSNSGEIIT